MFSLEIAQRLKVRMKQPSLFVIVSSVHNRNLIDTRCSIILCCWLHLYSALQKVWRSSVLFPEGSWPTVKCEWSLPVLMEWLQAFITELHVHAWLVVIIFLQKPECQLQTFEEIASCRIRLSKTDYSRTIITCFSDWYLHNIVFSRVHVVLSRCNTSVYV